MPENPPCIEPVKNRSEPVKHAGFLDGVEISREEAEALIMQARVRAGWIKEEDLAPPPTEEGEAAAEAEAEAEA